MAILKRHMRFNPVLAEFLDATLPAPAAPRLQPGTRDAVAQGDRIPRWRGFRCALDQFQTALPSKASSERLRR